MLYLALLRGRATSISQNEIFIRTELALNYYTKQPFEKKNMTVQCTVHRTTFNSRKYRLKVFLLDVLLL